MKSSMNRFLDYPHSFIHDIIQNTIKISVERFIDAYN